MSYSAGRLSTKWPSTVGTNIALSDSDNAEYLSFTLLLVMSARRRRSKHEARQTLTRKNARSDITNVRKPMTCRPTGYRTANGKPSRGLALHTTHAPPRATSGGPRRAGLER
ncbi:hypothetical protein EVAR_8236_1 [Eumeta japonica]|uniref:Uncharacterized protein n=1 Tax=Eumeta variegata TaxID=151549 RepID=A0A4C1TFR7_EUMVA|nr:hypothetical protein EVAR_8236_1 [Eumeta japonica]